MKKNYTSPECSLVLLESADLLTLSYDEVGDGENWDW